MKTNLFLHIEQAAHTAALGQNRTPSPTPAQCLAGNYKVGRARVFGLPISIENPRGSYRSGTDKSGKEWRTLMPAHYGYINGTKGNDGDCVDCFIGPLPDSEKVFVINQAIDGQFDEHKVMLCFGDAVMAKAAYLGSYERGWKGLSSMAAMSVEQFKWWLENGDMSQPILTENLPKGVAMKKVYWDRSGLPADGLSLDKVLYEIRRDDDADALLLDSVSVHEILEDSDGILVFDALVTPYATLERKMEVLRGVMDRASANLNALAVQISTPFKQRGVTNVAAIFELSDGQTISIFFHNPDVNPNKLAANDELISWKWLLNKKDITIVVAPEKGVDLNLKEVSLRIMKLAEKNSAMFKRANAKRSERMQNIQNLKDEISGLEKELSRAQSRLEAARIEAEDRKKAEENQLKIKQADLHYYDDGLFTVFIPNTESGEAVWNELADQNNGNGKVLTIHAEAVAQQLGAKGYTVEKIEKPSTDDTHDDELLADLGKPAIAAVDAPNVAKSDGEVSEFVAPSKPFETYLDQAGGDTFEAAKTFFKSELQGKVVNTVIGAVHLTGASWKEMKRGMKSDQIKAKLIQHVGGILSSGSYGGKQGLSKDRKDSFVAFHFFEKEVDIGEFLVTAGVTVGERDDGYKLLAYGLGHELEKRWMKKEAGLLTRGEEPREPTSPSSVSASLDSILGEGDEGINIVILKVIDKTTGKRLTDLEDNLGQGEEPEEVSDDGEAQTISNVPLLWSWLQGRR